GPLCACSPPLSATKARRRPKGPPSISSRFCFHFWVTISLSEHYLKVMSSARWRILAFSACVIVGWTRSAAAQTGKSVLVSVNAELTLLYRKMAGRPVLTAGPIKNPYFLGDSPVTAAKRFTHHDVDLYLVARLDGYTVSDVKSLIDRGAKPSRDGTIVLDGR